MNKRKILTVIFGVVVINCLAIEIVMGILNIGLNSSLI